MRLVQEMILGIEKPSRILEMKQQVLKGQGFISVSVMFVVNNCAPTTPHRVPALSESLSLYLKSFQNMEMSLHVFVLRKW